MSGTESITRFEIQQNDYNIVVHAWARTFPYDWGATRATLDGGTITADCNQGPITKKMVVSLDKEVLRAETTSPNGQSVDDFRRQ